MPRPVCFTIMPYGRKPTQVEAGKGPAQIDCNALWDYAYVPAIKSLGYEPVRADQDTGAMIITQMLERLYFADLVLADMTIPNGNVYYEVGIRHASREKGCVLLAADWAKPLFDVAQMRTAHYPLADGDVTEATGVAIRDAIVAAIAALAGGRSPMYESIRGYPTAVDESTASSMKDQMTALAAFQADVRAVRAVARSERMARAKTVVETYNVPPVLPAVAIALLLMLRDAAEQPDDWKVMLDFSASLSADLAATAEVREQRALALSQVGQNLEAIAALEALVTSEGATPERMGLLGGRYKRMYKSAAPEDRANYLRLAIEHYEQGMELDLNDYYCSSNLPRLYRTRNRRGDEDRAQAVLKLVVAACERAKKRGVADEWLRPTLLTAAFDDGDADKAEALADEVADDGPSRWKLESVLGDLASTADLTNDQACRARLTAVIASLKVVLTQKR
jgi:tetratricopeptide (TPR) repeat protein